MLNLSNFTGVFEIAFGLNALFYFFELGPRTEGFIEKSFDELDRLKKKKIEVTGNSEVYPIGFVVGCTYHGWRFFLSKATVMVSLLMLGLVIYCGFEPAATISTFGICALLTVSFGVPMLCLMIHQRVCSMIETAKFVLEEQIAEAGRT